MSNVFELRPRRAEQKHETRAVLAEMLEQDTIGDLHGSIHITETDEGTRFYALGACADRVQVGVLAMIRGLGVLAEKIVDSGTAGNTPGTGPIEMRWGTPRRTLPKRLREATNFGELE